MDFLCPLTTRTSSKIFRTKVDDPAHIHMASARIGLRGGAPTTTSGRGWWPFYTEPDPKEKARQTIEKGLEKTEETLLHTKQAVQNRVEDAKMHMRHGAIDLLSLVHDFFFSFSCHHKLQISSIFFIYYKYTRENTM